MIYTPEATVLLEMSAGTGAAGGRLVLEPASLEDRLWDEAAMLVARNFHPYRQVEEE